MYYFADPRVHFAICTGAWKYTPGRRVIAVLAGRWLVPTGANYIDAAEYLATPKV